MRVVSTAHWTGEVLLASGKLHPLTGGTVSGVTPDSARAAVAKAAEAEIRMLDEDVLQGQHGT